MLKSLFLSGLLASGVGAFASTPFDNQPLYSPSTQAVVFDDTDYITLSVEELNTYTFNNFANLLNTITNLDWADVVLTYNGDNLTYQEYMTNDYIYFDNDVYTITFSLESANSNFSKWIIEDSQVVELTFEYSLIIDFTALQNYGDIYTLSKQAIELDIQANQPQPSAGFISALVSFVTLLTSGIVALATGIASGVVGMAKALFLNSAATGLSIFGGLIAMFAGVALAVTLTTKVYQWITSLGN